MNYAIYDDLLDVLARVNDWALLKNARIFITGGTGFFGVWILSVLQAADQHLDLNLHITVLSRNPTAFLTNNAFIGQSDKIKFMMGDVANFEDDNEHYDYLIHLATTPAKATFQGEDHLKKLETLYFGTQHVLDFAVRKGVKKVLFTSSGVVYGDINQFESGVPEVYMGAPNVRESAAGLGEGKRVAEYLCAYYHEKFKLSVVVARCFSFIGPYLPLDLHYAAGNFIRNCIHQQDIVIQGDGKAVRSYLYMADAMVWLMRLLLSPKSFDTYNLGSSQAISIQQLAVSVSQASDNNTQIDIKNKNFQTGNFDRNYYVPNVEKIKTELGVEEYTNLKDAIMKTIRFYR